MAIGMSYDEFWNGDPSLAKDYRAAEKRRNRARNNWAHLQGLYFYDALLCASPIFHAFAKNGTKPHPYTEDAYPLTIQEQKEREYEIEKRKLEEEFKKMQTRAEAIKRTLRERAAAKNDN